MTKFSRCALVVLVACAIGAEFALAQPTSRSRALSTWAKTYGSDSPYEGLFDLRRAADGTIVVAGYTEGFELSASSGWLLRLGESDGAVRSQGVVANTLGGVVDGAGLSADGGALFTGRIVVDLFTKHDAWLVRVDSSGVPSWWRGFTRTGGFGRYFLHDAIERDNGSWVVVGTAGFDDQPPQAGWIVCLSSNGDILWQYEYQGGVSDHLESVTATADGGVAVAGWTNSSGAGGDDAWILKLDASGGIEWQKTFGGSDGDQATSIVELEEGGFAVAAHTRSFTSSGYAPWVLRLDDQGNLLWQAIASGVWGDFQSIAETDKGVIALGRVGEDGFPTNDLWSVEFADDGGVRWQRAYEGDSGDWGAAVLALPGSGFMFGGYWGWGFPEEDLWILRTGPDGRLPGCGLARQTSFPMIEPRVVVRSGVANRVSATALDQSYGFEFGSSQATVTNTCR